MISSVKRGFLLMAVASVTNYSFFSSLLLYRLLRLGK